MPDRDPTAFTQLIDRYLLGELSDAEVDQLEADLLADRDRAVAFIEVIEQMVMMREAFSDRSAEQTISEDSTELRDYKAILGALMPTEAPALVDLADELERRQAAMRRPVDRFPRPASLGADEVYRPLVIPKAAVWAAVAAVLMLGAWLVVRWSGPDHPPTAQGPDTPPEVYAILRDTHRARWAGPAPAVGVPLGDQTLDLVEGFARMDLSNGTTVLVEGPSRLSFDPAGQLHLTRGRLTADVPASGHGFTVVAPNAVIVDHGTAFGVQVDASQSTLARVFEGQVSMTPAAGPELLGEPVPLTAHQAGRVGPAAPGRVQPDGSKLDPFVRQGTYEALSGVSGPEAYADAVQRLWERDRDLIAAHCFLSERARGYGMTMRRDHGAPSIQQPSLTLDSPGAPILVPAGGRLVVESFEPFSNATVFFDLDLSPDSPAAQAGLLREDDGTLGRDGTRLCLAWSTVLETQPQGIFNDGTWCGLSLFGPTLTNTHSEEYLFFGRVYDRPGWSMGSHRSSPDSFYSQPRPTFAITGGGVEPQAFKTLRWLVVIDFRPGPDLVSVYLDPDRNNLGQPDFVYTQSDLRIDCLRFEAFGGNARWSMDELRLGTTPAAVLTN